MEIIGDKKDAEWQRLRKQKIAYQARLRNRQKRQSALDQAALTDQVIEMLKEEALKTVSGQSYQKLFNAIESEI